MRFLPLVILALPIAEIATFVWVGGMIGVLPTILLVLATGAVGVVLLRVQGLQTLSRLQAAMAEGRDPAEALVNGLMLLVAAVLLILPGFLTDLIGTALVLPPFRRLVWRMIRGRVAVAGFPGRGPSSARVIDLDAEDYSRRPSETSPWRRLEDD